MIKNWGWMLPFWVCVNCHEETTIFLYVLDIDKDEVVTQHGCSKCRSKITVAFDLQDFAQLIHKIPPIVTTN